MASAGHRKYLAAAFLLLLVVAAWGWWLSSRRGSIRNVLLISIDTCRADHFGCYGYRHRTTPNIDALAGRGVLFENAISPIPLTLPAHSSMLTGTIPPYHGVHENTGYRLADSIVCLPELLKDAGFATAAAISAFVLDSQHGLDQGFDVYDDTFREPLKGDHVVQRRGDETTEVALDWIERNRDRRFFYFLHYYDPHASYSPPEPFASRFESSPYAGEVAYTDDCIGKVIRKLKELDLYDSTLIIVVADHGEMLGEHGEPAHAYFIYQGAIRIPLIFKLPGRETPARVPALAGLVDIVPTVCSLLGVAPPSEIQGIDLSAHLAGKAARDPEPDRSMYCESFYPTLYGSNPLLGVVTRRFKFIRTSRPELYDLVEDPAESNNLSQDDPRRAKILDYKLEEILKASLRDTSEQSRAALDEEALRRIQSLGYAAGGVIESFDFDPSKPDAKDNLDFHLMSEEANELVATKRFDEARDLVERMIQRKPDHALGHKRMAIILAESEDYQQAIHHGRRAAELDPRDAVNHAALGRLHDTVGEPGRAAEHYRLSLDINPENAVVQNALGRIHLARRQFADAARCFQHAVRVKPDFPEALMDLGNACKAQGRVDQAIRHYRQALELDPESYATHYNLGNALVAKDRAEEAIHHYRLAIRHAPDHTKSYNNLAWLLATEKDAPFHDPAEAVRLARKACAITKNRSHELVDLLAIAHAAAGDFPEAVRAAQKAIMIAERSGDPGPLPSLRTRLELFKARRPYDPGPR